MAEIDDILAELGTVGDPEKCGSPAERARCAHLMARAIDLSKHNDKDGIVPLIARLQDVSLQFPDEGALRSALSSARRSLVEALAFDQPGKAMEVLAEIEALSQQCPGEPDLALEKAKAAYALMLAHLVNGDAAAASECESLMRPPSAELGNEPAWREMRARPLAARLLGRLGRAGCIDDGGPAWPFGVFADDPPEFLEMPTWLSETLIVSARGSGGVEWADDDIEAAFGYLGELQKLAREEVPGGPVCEVLSDVAALMTIGLVEVDPEAAGRAYDAMREIRGIDGIPRRFRAWATTARIAILEAEDIDQAQDFYERLATALEGNLAVDGLADAQLNAGGQLGGLLSRSDPDAAKRLYDELKSVAGHSAVSDGAGQQFLLDSLSLAANLWQANRPDAAGAVFRDIEPKRALLPDIPEVQNAFDKFASILPGKGKPGVVARLLGKLMGR